MKIVTLFGSLALMASEVKAAVSEEAVEVSSSWQAKTLTEALGQSALFGILGILLVLVGFKVFDRVITRVDFEKEIANGNVAAGVLCAAVVLGLSLIVAASIF